VLGTKAVQPFQCHGPDMSAETPLHAGVWDHVVETCGTGDSRSLRQMDASSIGTI